MTTAATTVVKDCVLAGFGGSGPARITVTHYARGERWRRGLQALARAWGIALVCVFIPVAHLVLVPSFLLYGIWSGWQRLTTAEVVTAARGTCPDCGAEQDLQIGSAWRVPQELACQSCGRGLRLTLAVVR